MDTQNETSVDYNPMEFYYFEIFLEKMRTGDKLIVKKGLVKADDRVLAEQKVSTELDYIRNVTAVNENEVFQLGFEVFSLLQ